MALKIRHLHPAPGANTAKTRVGRGEASRGRTTSRSTEGTGVRKNVPANFEGGQIPMYMRIPKFKGFKNPFYVEHWVANVGRLAELFPRGEAITVEDLVETGAARGGVFVKVLGDGDIDATLNVTADAFSNSVKEKPATAGGSAVEA